MILSKQMPSQASKGKEASKRKKGFTLTEIAIVLGIMGLILSAIWVAASGVYSNQRVNQANTGIMQVLQAVRGLYSQTAVIGTGVAADLTPGLITAGVIPTNLVATASTLVTPWGGSMFVGSSTDGKAIVISMGGMTAATCTALVSQVFGASHDRTLETTSLVGPTGSAAIAIPTEASGTAITTPANPVANATAKAADALPGATGTNCGPTTTNAAAFVFGLQG